MVDVSSDKRSEVSRFGNRRQTLVLYEGWPKRLLDLIFVVALAPFFVPLLGFFWLLARLDGGPGFFGHERVGRDGRVFKCWKIRTMVTDADARLAALLERDPEAREEWERDRKLKNDPRVTRIGGFLRKSSIDEVPQLFNVLRGDMSLVGPRPVPRDELTQYGAESWAYLSLRPGVTGLWQVSGRNDVSYDERVQLDVTYRNNVSFWKDTTILALTVREVLRRSGC